MPKRGPQVGSKSQKALERKSEEARLKQHAFAAIDVLVSAYD